MVRESKVPPVAASIRGEKIGRYELLAPLNAGGMSQVFLGATTAADGKRELVVIKRLLPDSATDEHFIAMFLDEARITAGFNHSSIARVIDLGSDGGSLYVAMELISGANLNDVFDTCASKQEVLPLGFTASVAHDCALALHYAHTFRDATGADGSVIHRDVAQKNIMVTYEGEVKLLDFGIAKARNALSRTRAGTVKGTAGYMSPEQVRGETVDARSDVFSLGVVLWEMTTGRRLFAAPTEIDEMKLILSGPIVPPHQVAQWIPASLSEVTMAALARSRDERYSSARELARALSTRCEDLLFDSAGRREFMHRLFERRIETTAALFEAAGQPAQPELLEAALAALEHESPPLPAPAPKSSGPRRKKKEPANQEDTSQVNERLLLLALEADRLGEKPRRAMLSLTTPFVVAVTVLLCVMVAYKLFVVDRRPTRSGLQRYQGDPIEDEQEAKAPIGAVGASGPPSFEPHGVPGVDTGETLVGASSPSLVLPPPSVKSEKAPRAQGEVTLAIFPEASVFRGAEKLGRPPCPARGSSRRTR